MPHPPDHTLAATLADAFLQAAGWSTTGLLAAGEQVLGRVRPWLTRLTGDVLSAYPRPPIDAPGELAALIRASDSFADSRADSWRRDTPPRRLLVRSATAGVPRFGIPRLDDEAALSALLDVHPDELRWFADPQLRLRRENRQRLHHYRYRWVAGSASSRLLETPMARLKDLQRQVLDHILSPFPVHPAAHGFVPGRSVITGARPHVGAAVVVSLDLESSFAAVSAARVHGILRSAGIPETVCRQITGLVTHSTPVAVISAMPRTSDPGKAGRGIPGWR